MQSKSWGMCDLVEAGIVEAALIRAEERERRNAEKAAKITGRSGKPATAGAKV